VTHLRCSEKYGTSLVTVESNSEGIFKIGSANISQSYERISSGTFLVAPHAVYICSTIHAVTACLYNVLLLHVSLSV